MKFIKFILFCLSINGIFVTGQALADKAASNYNLLDVSRKGQIYDPYKLIENGDLLISGNQGHSKYIYVKKRYDTYKGFVTVKAAEGDKISVYMRTYNADGSFGSEKPCQQKSENKTSYFCNLPPSDNDRFFIRVSAGTSVINAQVHMESSPPR